MSIPSNQFYVFTVAIVRYPINSSLGVCFTFKDAYERVSKYVEGAPLIEDECLSNDTRIVYYSSKDATNKFVIQSDLLTYYPSKNVHLVSFEDMNPPKDVFMSLLQERR